MVQFLKPDCIQCKPRLILRDDKNNVVKRDSGAEAITFLPPGSLLSTENGKVVLKLSGVVKEVLDRVDDQFGLDIASKVPADKLNVGRREPF